MAQATIPTEALAGFISMIASYEHRIGHVCRAVATHIPPLLTNLPVEPIIHDNACGTGAATEELLKALPSARVFATDIMPPMIQAFRATVADSSALQNAVVQIDIMHGQDMKYDDDYFDASITNFGIFFFPDPALGAREVYRTLKPGGTAIFTLWKDLGFKPVLWEVQKRVKPTTPLTELPLVEPWCDGGLLKQTLQQVGFSSIEMVIITEGMWGTGRKGLEDVLLQNFAAMVWNNWTDEEKAKLPEVTDQVLEDHEDEFCIKSGDRFGVPMTAWIAGCKN